MERVVVSPNIALERGLLGKRVERAHVGYKVKPDSIIVDEATGEPLIVFGRFSAKHTLLRSRLPKVKFQNNQRIARVKAKSDNQRSSDISFGFKPMRPVFGVPASACIFNTDHPTTYDYLKTLGAEMMGLYQRYNPKVFDRQRRLMLDIGDQWKVPGTFFTQGIINDTVNLDFHYDRGNIKGAWSCMAVFLADVAGGELVIPSLGLSLGIEDETYVFFDGQKLLHGVAPIETTTKFGRRFSVVYYALEVMKNCGSSAEEIQRMREVDARKHKKRLTEAKL